MRFVTYEITIDPILLVFLLPAIAAFFISKAVFFALIFIILDIMKNYLELRLYLNWLPFKFITIGIITLSYMFNYWIGFVLVAFYAANKIIFGRFDERPAVGAISLTIIALLADFLGSLAFGIIAISLFILKYVLDFFIFWIAYGYPKLDNLPGRIINCIAAYPVILLISFLI